jgi:MFS family permease
MSRAAIPRVLAAEAVSNFGSMLSRFTLPLLAALVLQATPAQMALLLVADVLAGVVGSLFLGAWVDRSGKRAVMLLTDGLRCCVMLLLALAAWQGWVVFTLLVLAAAANGVLGVAFDLARSAWVAQQVQPGDLPRRNAQLSMAGSLSETAAFALGGWLYQVWGAVLALLVDAVSYVASAACLRAVPEAATGPQAASTKQPGQALRELLRELLRESGDGLRLVAAHPRLLPLAGIEALGGMAYALTGTVYTLFVTRDLGLPTGQLGVIAALGGLGAVAGAALAPRLGRQLGGGKTMALGLALYALGTACIPLAQGAGWVAVAYLVAHQVVGDAGHTLHDVHDRTLRQTAVPADQLARADAGVRAAGQLALLLGAGLGALLGTVLGSRSVLCLAAACGACAALLAWRRLAR